MERHVVTVAARETSHLAPRDVVTHAPAPLDEHELARHADPEPALRIGDHDLHGVHLVGPLFPRLHRRRA